MASTSYQEIRDSLHQLYVEDPRPWGGDNRPLYKLHASAGGFSLSASNGERAGVRCRFQPACTVIERDKASEGLLASGDERMEKLIEFRETLLFYQDPDNGKRDMKRKNGADGPSPLQSKHDHWQHSQPN